MRRLILCLAVAAVMAATAMPSKKDVTAARDVVSELMADAVADQKAGKLTAAQVAEKALDLAGRAETEAAKLLLIQGAVMGFARGGEPARAAEAMQRMKAEIKDVTPEYEADVLARAVKTVPAKSGRLLYSMLDDAKRLVKFRKDVAVIEKKLAKTDTPELRMQLAERLAALGEWKRALEMLAKMDGDVARAAKFERGELTAMTASEVADIWWAQKGTKDSAGFTVFQRHAGEWYRKALADGSLKGLKRDLAQKRLEGMEGGYSAARSASAPYRGGDAISRADSGEPRPVAADGNAPAQGRAGAPRTPPPTVQNGKRPDNLVFKLDSKTNLEMVGIPAGTFTMGYSDWERCWSVTEMCKPHEVTITRPFWAAKYPVTLGMCIAIRFAPDDINRHMKYLQDQGGLQPNEARMAMARFTPRERVDDFLALLNKRIGNRPKGYVFRLPTMAEWEYCLKADGSDENLLRIHPRWNEYVLSKNVVAFLKEKGFYKDDTKQMWQSFKLVPVNLFRPNPWGLCRLFEVDGEWIMDTVDDVKDVIWGRKGSIPGLNSHVFSGVKGVSLPEHDPIFIATSKSPERLVRGYMFTSSGICVPNNWGSARIVLGPDLLAEQAKKR